MDTNTNIAEWIPVPYFQINQEGTILKYSKQINSYFQHTSNIWNIIHEKDRHKAVLLLAHQTQSQPLTQHLALLTNHKLFVLFKCTIQWKDSIGHLVCTEAKDIKVPSSTYSSIGNSLADSQKCLGKSEKHLKNATKTLSKKKT
ncbi:hypothetical protein [Priestia megaterium]|uniref:hypothetical protein n=1 Tax=Priestia megaterium TaxID=1404 RepID=UPI00366EFDB8